MVLPILIIFVIATVVIFAIFLFLFAFWVFSNPWQAAIIAIALAFIVVIWKSPAARKKIFR